MGTTKSTKSGWCVFPQHDIEQHKGCKEVFESKGFDTWICSCMCHDTKAPTATTATATIPDATRYEKAKRIDGYAGTAPPITQALPVVPVKKAPDNRTRAEKTAGK